VKTDSYGLVAAERGGSKPKDLPRRACGGTDVNCRLRIAEFRMASSQLHAIRNLFRHAIHG